MNAKPAQTEKCGGCKGTGKMQVKCVNGLFPVGHPMHTTVESLTCIRCNGAKLLPLGSNEAHDSAREAFWCKGEGPCENASPIFHDDGECDWCEKHHYHCAHCGKVSQVG